ncbi:class I SAM-dependent DNA methyltransferase [Alkaliphilus serpentinus]|uniref:Class I SAM-dependent methyltransferase n=1 Tax=Alkaliphilus serpentinus TaxID=1482731 RepID=A0A833M744_9FIRM|nr:class I SAM-dependent methyltransferase [Alkaliphilus serpentinus]KAB3529501.1 class I SAM-dependent methyltransferase [Alkaliphilus serpentinus]
MSDAYEIFSRFYDEYIFDTAPNLHMDYFNLIKLIIEKFKLDVNSILDLTCGTGTLLKLLTENGFNSVEGIDVSPEMLQKAKEKGLKVYEKNIKEFDLKRKYDLIVSFDSLGHIKDEKDLSKIFNNISNHLNDGGLFLCDGGTREKAKRMIGQKYTYE